MTKNTTTHNRIKTTAAHGTPKGGRYSRKARRALARIAAEKFNDCVVAR